MAYNQREHYRVPLKIPAAIRINGKLFRKATCHNISMGGMGLSLEGEIETKSSGTVQMSYAQAGGSVSFNAQFSVAWTRTERPDELIHQAGIRFTDVDDENRNRLVQIIIARLREMESNGES